MASDGHTSTDNHVPRVDKDEKFDDNSKVPFMTFSTFMMAILVSMGGICFGYDTGQISGFLEMENFRYNFADDRENLTLSDIRTGLIVAMLSIGTLVGALIAGPIANNRRLGRKYSIVLWCIVFCIGNVFQMASQYPYWWIMMMGRIIAGFAIGGLSVMVPAYQGESAPTHLRGAIVCCYQLFITIGILIAYLINFGTVNLTGFAQWRVPVGISFVWAFILGGGILFFPETPRHEYRNGNIDSAAASVAKFYGVSVRHRVVKQQLAEMQQKFELEIEAGKPTLRELFLGPRMMYRILLGITIQALQQMTGANFFFYYGTSIFSSVGIENSFITQIILGAVNVITTFPGLYMVEKFGRRKCLSIGAACMFVCYMVFASLGYFVLDPGNTGDPEQYNRTIGYVMIVFACLFIASFASTWGPMAWAVTSEIYPSRYRSQCISFCAASNWLFNFFIGFATPFITSSIGFSYGYLFAACNAIAVLVVFFFLPETSGKSLEAIDTMFLQRVKPWKSSKWAVDDGDNLGAADRRASVAYNERRASARRASEQKSVQRGRVNGTSSNKEGFGSEHLN